MDQVQNQGETQVTVGIRPEMAVFLMKKGLGEKASYALITEVHNYSQ